MALRVTVRVGPGARRTVVGGRHGDQLVVKVAARAVDGKATEAALQAVADAFGLRRRQVDLVTGATSRTKVLELDGPDPELQARLEDLLAHP